MLLLWIRARELIRENRKSCRVSAKFDNNTGFLFLTWIENCNGEAKYWCWLKGRLVSLVWLQRLTGIIVTTHKCSMLEFTQHAYGFRTHVLILGLLAVCTVCHGKESLFVTTSIQSWSSSDFALYVMIQLCFMFPIVCFYFYSEANDLQSKSCTGEQSTAKRNSFNFRKFGNVTGLEDCVDICCRDDACELAILSRGFHCYGVSCDKPKLCHKILDKLLMEDERQLQRNPRNAGEIFDKIDQL